MTATGAPVLVFRNTQPRQPQTPQPTARTGIEQKFAQLRQLSQDAGDVVENLIDNLIADLTGGVR